MAGPRTRARKVNIESEISFCVKKTETGPYEVSFCVKKKETGPLFNGWN